MPDRERGDELEAAPRAARSDGGTGDGQRQDEEEEEMVGAEPDVLDTEDEE